MRAKREGERESKKAIMLSTNAFHPGLVDGESVWLSKGGNLFHRKRPIHARFDGRRCGGGGEY